LQNFSVSITAGPGGLSETEVHCGVIHYVCGKQKPF